ncbi:hypothetical protein AAG589_21130 [Isoptericola sp. F-RaC21]|uniref:hypothetical protein n=1 Tax=Isoptericola sp. F-RaC21 TaxID=3141452 RepID=UPI00315C3D99
MDVMHTLGAAHDTVQHLAAVLPMDLDIPDKGSIAPGADAKDKAGTLIGALRWIGGALALVGLILIACEFLIPSRRRDAGEKAGNLGWWAAGAFMLGAVFSIVGWIL